MGNILVNRISAVFATLRFFFTYHHLKNSQCYYLLFTRDQVKLATLESSLEEWRAAGRAHGVSSARALGAALEAAFSSQLTAADTSSKAQATVAQLTEVMTICYKIWPGQWRVVVAEWRKGEILNIWLHNISAVLLHMFFYISPFLRTYKNI